MNKQITDYNILLKEELIQKGYIVLNKKEIKDALKVSTEAFENYDLYRYIKPKFNLKHWIMFKDSVYRAMYKDMVVFTDPTRSCCCGVCCNQYQGTKNSSYIANGIFKSFFTIGLKAILKFSKFDKFILNLRKKHTKLYCIYGFDIIVKKSEQGKGIGKGINNLLQEFCNKYKRNMFFETLTKRNCEYYQQLGYELVEEVKLPDAKDITVYCFMYRHK